MQKDWIDITVQLSMAWALLCASAFLLYQIGVSSRERR